MSRRRSACLAALAAGLAAAMLGGCSRPAARAEEPPAEPSVLVHAELVSRGPMWERVECLGTVEFDPGRLRELALLRAGEVLSIEVSPGQVVDAGAPLLRLGPVPGAQLDVERARLDVAYAERELERANRLAAARLATNREVSAAENSLAQARAALRALGGDPTERDLVVRAPAAGIVAEVSVRPGALAREAQPAVKLAPLDGLQIRTGFEIEDLGRLSTGQEVRVAPALAPETEPVTGSLAQLHRLADPATQLIEGLVLVPKPPAWMVPGARVRVQVVTRSAPEALRIPAGALVEREGEPGVFAIEAGRARFLPVVLGMRDGQAIEVTGGLEEGTLVATAGRSSLEDGRAVRMAGPSPAP